MLGEGLSNDAPWMVDAKCARDKNFRDQGITYAEWQSKNRDRDFFDDHGPYVQEARRYCQDCPVSIECHGYATSESIQWGIWGGLTSLERRRLLRKTRKLLLELIERMPELPQDDEFPTAS